MHIIALVNSAILGIVEGITEFLPVSSTGHLIIAERFFKLAGNHPTLAQQHFISSFEVVIQLGAILAIVVLFWKTLWPWATPKEERMQTWKLWLRIIVGLIPAAVLGFAFQKVITEKLFNPTVVSITLIFYGIILIIMELRFRKDSRDRLQEIYKMSLGVAFVIGLFQTLALIPGTSRSAATIIGGMIMGLGRASAAEFSFFMAVPIMVGASGLTLVKEGLHFTAGEWVSLLIGFVVAFISALIVVRAFINFLKRRDFVPFGYYRIALGLVVIVLVVTHAIT